MDVDFCPNCKKAGLRYKDHDGHYPVDFLAHDVLSRSRETKKWCPRCKEWVKPKAHNVMNR